MTDLTLFFLSYIMCMQVLSIVVVIEIRISGVKVEAGFDTGYESDSLVC